MPSRSASWRGFRCQQELRLEIAPNGSVKSIESVGGNPLLIKAAQEAVTKWMYAPALHETRELIELRFDVK